MTDRDLVRRLYDTYYCDGGRLQADGRNTYVSSYWNSMSGQFRVEMNEQGEISSLSTIALGNERWTSRGMMILDHLCIASHLLHLPHRTGILNLYRTTRQVCRSMGLDPTLNTFRHACALDLIRRNLNREGSRRLRFLMIGDGHGVLSALVKSVCPGATIFLVDIGRTLVLQAHFCRKAHPSARHVLASDITDPTGADFVYCPTEDLEHLGRFSFDVAINIASMQEMNQETVSRYFDFLRKTLGEENLFYCCNREFKEMEGGEVSEILRYPWQAGDRMRVDGPCPWFHYFFAKGRTLRELHVLGIRIPLVKFFNGDTRHRLAVMAVRREA